MHVAKWGNSLALRLPVAVVDALRLKEGDDIEVRVAGDRAFEIKRKPGRPDYLDRLRKFRGTLPVDFLFERDSANSRD